MSSLTGSYNRASLPPVFLDSQATLASSKCIAFIKPVASNHVGRMCGGKTDYTRIGDCANPELFNIVTAHNKEDVYIAHFFDGKKVYRLERVNYTWLTQKPLMDYLDSLAKTKDPMTSIKNVNTSTQTLTLHELPPEEADKVFKDIGYTATKNEYTATKTETVYGKVLSVLWKALGY